MAALSFSNVLTTTDPQKNAVLIVGQAKNLALASYNQVRSKLEPRVNEETYNTAVLGLHPSPTDSCSLWLNNATVAALPPKCSRHNTPSRCHSLTKVIKSCLVGGEESIVIICERSDVYASACAVARALPLYSAKSQQTQSKRNITVEFVLVGLDADVPLSEDDMKCLDTAAQAVRLAAKIVDMPCANMHTDAFVAEIKRIGQELKIDAVVIQGEDLNQKGFGGIYGVGKAATRPPALAVLSHRPAGATRNIAWVGKGIVFDTGGLCIKSKTGMGGMKRDCGGAAGILAAFSLAVKMGFKENLHAVFCLAENAVGPKAFRPDDILTMYSGRTVEINNTDAEGRLVLADGVVYAQKDLQADVIVDMATLTGAQGIATGNYIYLEFSFFVAIVLRELSQFLQDRSNAQVSCAGLFIGSHLGFDYPGVWIHIDMASPVYVGERATGYGAALLPVVFGQFSESPLLKSISPSIFSAPMEAGDTNSPKKQRLQ
ncbi:probable aminopeptidase NPEPL1 [Gigantopelta aegis]|uniref:probable aminopeptidase NPEPL1 n=1 Tax=Gigantopelta aegis TaxID=1735272 RepID=UPI001B88BE73|nr:probable aminopeptidase NPEPL1 [Gigantopelta aegis]